MRESCTPKLVTLAAIALLVAGLTFVPTASADTIFTLNRDGCTGNCLNALNTSAGTVTLHEVGATVDVTVALNSSFGFIDTGSHDTFTFNISGNPTITVTNLSPGFTFSNNNGNNPPFGAFNVYIDCNHTGNPYCGNGASHPIYGTLKFNVSLSSGTISIASFVGNSNTPPIFFAADVFSNNSNGGTGTGNTGAVGATGPGTQELILTPEPASLTLLGSGLVGVLGLLRRKR